MDGVLLSIKQQQKQVLHSVIRCQLGWMPKNERLGEKKKKLWLSDGLTTAECICSHSDALTDIRVKEFWQGGAGLRIAVKN